MRFEACYYLTYVLVNGKLLGSHKGGYTPFAFDITDAIENGKAEIVVYVEAESRDGRKYRKGVKTEG